MSDKYLYLFNSHSSKFNIGSNDSNCSLIQLASDYFNYRLKKDGFVYLKDILDWLDINIEPEDKGAGFTYTASKNSRLVFVSTLLDIPDISWKPILLKIYIYEGEKSV